MPRRVSKEAKKAEDTQLRDYELSVVFSPELGEEELGAAVTKLSQFIVEREGAVSTMQQLGKRKLAYSIKHFMEGNYVLAQVKLKPALSKELTSHLEITEEALRYLLVQASS